MMKISFMAGLYSYQEASIKLRMRRVQAISKTLSTEYSFCNSGHHLQTVPQETFTRRKYSCLEKRKKYRKRPGEP